MRSKSSIDDADGAGLRVLVLHGIPTGPRLWERVPWPQSWVVSAPPLPTVEAGGPGPFDLEAVSDALAQECRNADVIVGHDLGGVLAAMRVRPGQGLVLCGTSLHRPYWDLMRTTAFPLLDRFFYDRHAGRRFLAEGCGDPHRAEAIAAFLDHGPDWPERMKRVARGLRVPWGLRRRLAGVATVWLWGAEDPWYPLALARWDAARTRSPLLVRGCRHLVPWEEPQAVVDAVRLAAAGIKPFLRPPAPRPSPP